MTKTIIKTPIKVRPLASLASKPKLISVLLDDEATMEANDGYAMEFFTYDRQPFETIMLLATAAESGTEDGQRKTIEMARKLILDCDGKPIIDGEVTFQTPFLLAAIHKVTKLLGN